MRLFIGVEIGEPAKEELVNALEKLKNIAAGNFTLPQNLHLTLQFLGEKQPVEVAAIKRAMREAAKGSPRLQFSLLGPGRFPRGEESIFWYGIGGDTEKLNRLAADVQRRLIENGISFEKDNFKPHITLGRRIRTRIPIPEAFESIRAKTAGFTVEELVLFESTHVNSVLTYIPVARERLHG
jgi:2'-5' RNA ligase